MFSSGTDASDFKFGVAAGLISVLLAELRKYRCARERSALDEGCVLILDGIAFNPEVEACTLPTLAIGFRGDTA